MSYLGSTGFLMSLVLWAAAPESASAPAAPVPQEVPRGASPRARAPEPGLLASEVTMGRSLAEGDEAFAFSEYAAAIAAYSRISPARIPVAAQNRLAMSYHLLGRLDEAQAIYRVLTARDREYAPGQNNLGALYYVRGEFGDAEARFRDALRYVPRDAVVQGNLHAARYARENERAARDLATRMSSDNLLLLEPVSGDVFEISILIDPEVREELRLLALRGDIFMARKMFEDAILEYQRYLDIDAYDVRIRSRLGLANQQAQRISDAEDEYREALKLNPYFVPALNNLGSIAQARKSFPLALDYYRRALEIDEASPTVIQNLASCLFAMERYEEGLLAYIRAIQIDPSLFDRIGGGGGTLVQTVPGNESMANFYLAKLFAGSGNLDRTMSFLYRAVEEGFDDRDMLEDPVFAELRSDDRFVRLLASLDETS